MTDEEANRLYESVCVNDHARDCASKSSRCTCGYGYAHLSLKELRHLRAVLADIIAVRFDPNAALDDKP